MKQNLVLSPEFDAWRAKLSSKETRAVDTYVNYLRELQFALKMPHCRKLQNTKLGVWELRPTANKVELRVFYVWSPKNQAFILTGGSKAGQAARAAKWYKRKIAQAESVAVKRYGFVP